MQGSVDAQQTPPHNPAGQLAPVVVPPPVVPPVVAPPLVPVEVPPEPLLQAAISKTSPIGTLFMDIELPSRRVFTGRRCSCKSAGRGTNRTPCRSWSRRRDRRRRSTPRRRRRWEWREYNRVCRSPLPHRGRSHLHRRGG